MKDLFENKINPNKLMLISFVFLIFLLTIILLQYLSFLEPKPIYLLKTAPLNSVIKTNDGQEFKLIGRDLQTNQITIILYSPNSMNNKIDSPTDTTINLFICEHPYFSIIPSNGKEKPNDNQNKTAQ